MRLLTDTSTETIDSGAKSGESSVESTSTKPEILLNKSASQPFPCQRFKVKGSWSEGASQTVGSTLGPAIDSSGFKSTEKQMKRPRLMFGVAASGGCTKCAQLRRSLKPERGCTKCARLRKSLKCEIANLKKAKVRERKTFEKEVNALNNLHSRLEGTIKFTQEVCSSYKNECEELKKRNQMLMAKLLKELTIF